MTAKVITFGIQKGGASKSTSSGITAKILSKKHKVLCIDMDSQGNLTALLTGQYDLCNVFPERTIMEGILTGDVSPYIVEVDENLHIVPSNDYLSALSRALRAAKLGMDALKIALDPVMDKYDYIIIDTPPNLGEQTVLSLCVPSPAGSYTVVMFDGSLFCYFAIEKYLEIVAEAKRRKLNPDLKVAGILFVMIDSNVKENIAMKKMVDETYPGLRFETLIRRRAATRRLPIEGFENNKELSTAFEFYYPFVKELEKRMEHSSVEAV